MRLARIFLLVAELCVERGKVGEGKEVMTLGKGSKKQKESVFLARKCSKKSRNRKEKRKEK